MRLAERLQNPGQAAEGDTAGSGALLAVYGALGTTAVKTNIVR